MRFVFVLLMMMWIVAVDLVLLLEEPEPLMVYAELKTGRYLEAIA